MDKDHIKTLANFMRTQDPRLVFVIPLRGPDHREVHLNDAAALGQLRSAGQLKRIPFEAMDLRDLTDVDEQYDAGGLIVRAGTLRYLIPYAPIIPVAPL